MTRSFHQGQIFRVDQVELTRIDHINASIDPAARLEEDTAGTQPQHRASPRTPRRAPRFVTIESWAVMSPVCAPAIWGPTLRGVQMNCCNWVLAEPNRTGAVH